MAEIILHRCRDICLSEVMPSNGNMISFTVKTDEGNTRIVLFDLPEETTDKIKEILPPLHTYHEVETIT